MRTLTFLSILCHMQSVRGVLGEALAASQGGLAALAGKAAQQDSKALQVSRDLVMARHPGLAQWQWSMVACLAGDAA
jgi:hypothetical protein